jgi:hypothetical protein
MHISHVSVEILAIIVLYVALRAFGIYLRAKLLRVGLVRAVVS